MLSMLSASFSFWAFSCRGNMVLLVNDQSGKASQNQHYKTSLTGLRSFQGASDTKVTTLLTERTYDVVVIGHFHLLVGVEFIHQLGIKIRTFNIHTVKKQS